MAFIYISCDLPGIEIEKPDIIQYSTTDFKDSKANKKLSRLYE